MTVGGWKKSEYTTTNELFTYDERSRKWKQTLPPMPTARDFPSVLSLQSVLVVASRNTSTSYREYTNAVEIFKADTSQWYRTDPLPTACAHLSLVAIGNTCYAVGHYNHLSHPNQVLYASVDELLHKGVPENQTTHSFSSAKAQSAWKTLATTPTCQPAAAVLAGKLLVIGGKESSDGEVVKKEVYVFSPSTNLWIYISDLPGKPLSDTTVALLSSAEILVIGGRCGEDRVKTTYKGTLQLKL